MPAFTLSTPALVTLGPVVLVALRPPRQTQMYYHAQGLPYPTVNVKAMIDTGASSSAVRVGLASSPIPKGGLFLYPASTILVSTPSSLKPVTAFEFDVEFFFLPGIQIHARVTEMPLRNMSVDCLIGRDVLSNGLLVYNGPMGQFTFSV